jgi:putative inorganic carbon (hco3(-)) transporter
LISKKWKSFEWLASAVCIGLSIFLLVSIAFSNFIVAYSIFYISIIALIIGYSIHHKFSLFSILFLLIPLSFSTKLIGDFEIQFPTEPIIALIAIFAILSINKSLEFYKNILRHPISKIILIEIIWLLICSLNSELKQVSFKYTVVRICYALIFYVLIIQWLQKYNKPSYFFFIYSLGFVIPILNGLKFHSKWNFSQKVSYIMPQPFFNDHTVYGACLAFLIPILFALLIYFDKFFKNKKMILIILPIVVLFCVAEYFSFSRASWLSLVLSALLYIALKLGLTSKIFITTLIIGLLFVWMNQNALIDKLNESNSLSNKDDLRQQITSITNIQTDVSNTERINRWKCALRMGIEKPVFGFGPRTYKFFYADYQTRQDLNRTSTFNGDKGHAHSEYLSFFAECGAIGFIIHLLFFFIPLVEGINLVQKSKLKKNKIMATAFLLGFFTYFTHGFFNGFMEEEKMSSLVFVSMAVFFYIDEAERKNLEIT